METSNERASGPVDATCVVCKKDVHAIRPAAAWKLAVALTWLVCVSMVAGMAVIGYAAIGVVALAPTVMLMGVSMLSAVHTKAFEPATCPHCERYVKPLGALEQEKNEKAVRGTLRSATTAA